MVRLLVIISIAIFGSICSAQDCNNPLLATFNLPGLTTPESGSGLPYCQNLQNGQTCCSAQTVGTFQGLTNVLTDQLQSVAAVRDRYIVDLRNNFIVQYQALIGTLQNFGGQIPGITVQNNALGNNLTAESTTFTDLNNQLTSINNDFDDAFQDYQSTRVECFQDLLQVQASIWCLACDPNYASNGVGTDGTITFSNDLNQDISNECYDFLLDAERFNPFIRAQQSFSRLQNLVAYMTEFTSSSVIPNRVLNRTEVDITNATERTVGVPLGCDDDNNCVWQGQNLFPRGVLNRTIAGNGAGVIGGANIVFDQLGVVNSTNGNNASAPVPVVAPAALNTSNNIANNTNNTTARPIGVANSTTVNNTSNNTDDSAQTPAPVAAVNTSNSTTNNTDDTTPTPANSTNAANNTRLLQSAAQGTFSPNLDETGLNFNVAADPAGVAPASPSSVDSDGTDDGSSGSVLSVGMVTIAALTVVTLL